MAEQAKRRAQEAADSKAALLRDLAEAHRLTAGGSLPDGTGRGRPAAG